MSSDSHRRAETSVPADRNSDDSAPCSSSRACPRWAAVMPALTTLPWCARYTRNSRGSSSRVSVATDRVRAIAAQDSHWPDFAPASSSAPPEGVADTHGTRRPSHHSPRHRRSVPTVSASRAPTGSGLVRVPPAGVSHSSQAPSSDQTSPVGRQAVRSSDTARL